MQDSSSVGFHLQPELAEQAVLVFRAPQVEESGSAVLLAHVPVADSA